MNQQEHIIETFSEMASRYEKLMNSELSLFWGINYYDFISEVLGDVEIRQTDAVLDIATGTAFIPRYFRKKQNLPQTITGLDITYEMLSHGKREIKNSGGEESIGFVCASAHDMPFKPNSFDIAICCLATHHMDVPKLLSQIQDCLKPGGKVFIGDVGGSAKWKIGLIRTVIKFFAFLFFLFRENLSRAKAESEAVANVMTSEEWHQHVIQNGFDHIQIREISSTRFWTPNPVIIKAMKKLEEN